MTKKKKKASQRIIHSQIDKYTCISKRPERNRVTPRVVSQRAEKEMIKKIIIIKKKEKWYLAGKSKLAFFKNYIHLVFHAIHLVSHTRSVCSSI